MRTRTDFRIDNDRLNVADADVFKRDPVNLIRFFAEAHLSNSFLHPDAIRLLRQSRRLIDDDLRENPEANRIFVELLTGDTNPEMSLRRMNEAGVLGRFVPEFGRVVGMTQFNMYHSYTVDEHLVRTVGMLTDIERGGASNELPLSTEIIGTIKNRRALYVAAFLHDIGKGHTEDHSIVGARIARELCPRFGLTPAETETVCLADRAASDDEQHRAKPRSVRSQDHPRLRRRRAEPGAFEAAAAADRCRHPRCRARRVERLEGAALAHALLRDRAAGCRRPHAGEAQPAHRRGAGDVASRSHRLEAGRRRSLHRSPLRRLLVAHRRRAPGRARQAVAPRRARRLARRYRYTHRRLHGHHRADGRRAQPSAPAGAVRRRLRGRRGQHRRRSHHDDARRICARHVPAQPRLQGRRG